MADINNYKSRIMIYKRAYTANGHGGFTQSWTEVDTVWCKITPLVGREAFNYRQVFPKANYKVLMRYRPDVNQDMRLYYNHRYWDILSVQDLNNMHDELEILAEVTPDEIEN